MKIDITPEMFFQTARSGGKGGQNVNKVETMVEGRWFVNNSDLITERQKAILLSKLGNKITKDGALLVKSQYDRSQLRNKHLVIERINQLINDALAPKKARIATKVPESVNRKRLENKKIKSILKKNRGKWKDE